MNINTHVVLPVWIWTKAADKQEFKINLAAYMHKNYRAYTVIEVHKHYAICRRA